MVNSKSIVTYKLVYDPDKKKKCKTVQVEQNGTTNFFAIPIVSGEKGVEFQLNEQTKPFFELSDALNYTGQQKFENYGKYLSGAIKTTWELVLADDFPNAGHRTHPGFKRALIAVWKRFYGQQDLREACLKMISKLEWKKIHKKYGDKPAKYTQRVENLYTIISQLNITPGTTPMPTTRQKNKQLVESFPKDYRLYFVLRGGDYTQPMNAIGRVMAEKYDRDKDSDSDASDSPSSSDEGSSDDQSSSGEESLSSSDDSSSNDEKKKRKRKRRKKLSKKEKKQRRKKSKRHQKKKQRKNRKKEFHGTPKPSDICPIHGGHKWADCRLNNRGNNYDPPVKRDHQYSQQGYKGSSSQGQSYQSRGGRPGQNQGRGAQHGTNQYHFGDEPCEAPSNEPPRNSYSEDAYMIHALGKYGVPNGAGGVRPPRVGEPAYSAYRRHCTKGF